MEHILYSDGNTKEISWVIKSYDKIIKQSRTHAKIYYDKVTQEQSKYIALHVGIFWGIGTFIINNGEKLQLMLDIKSMYEVLGKNFVSNDIFINNRISFIKQLLQQHNIRFQYKLISTSENMAKILY
ncbi:MAG: hypothetical protein KAF24_02455 [Nitrosopumilaceae archaeon]|nr:hypothetical protein [Nitrosopumilaceae archaeon]